MPEPVTTSLTILGIVAPAYVGKKGVDLTYDFLKRVLAPVGDAAGETVAHPLKQFNERRAERANKMVQEAARLLDASGKTATAVPGRILFPILEHGSLEDESEELRQKWIQLLANAADADGPDSVPSFVPHILAELGPIEVKILDHVFKSGDHTSGVYPCERPKVRDATGLQPHEVSIWIENLTRLGLLSVPLGVIPTVDSSKKGWEDVVTGEYRGTTYLTSMGYTFIACCTFDDGPVAD